LSDYWIYENWGLRRIRVHLGDCRYCHDGKGWKRYATEKTGKWHGPYANYRDTFRFSGAYKDWDIRDCSVCIPSRRSRVRARFMGAALHRV
jgi:F-type H+-transporting ATPase subunit beta